MTSKSLYHSILVVLTVLMAAHAVPVAAWGWCSTKIPAKPVIQVKPTLSAKIAANAHNFVQVLKRVRWANVGLVVATLLTAWGIWHYRYRILQLLAHPAQPPAQPAQPAAPAPQPAQPAQPAPEVQQPAPAVQQPAPAAVPQQDPASLSNWTLEQSDMFRFSRF